MTKLQEIESSGQYYKLPDALLFDEHSEYDADGKLLRTFDKKKLQSMVDFWNKRADGGNLAQLGPGHLLRNAPETLQPAAWGLAGKAKLAPIGDGRVGLYADLYIKKQVEVVGADGKPKLVSAREGLAEFPKPSIELWKTDGGIDWIALLKSRPERDLGLLTVSYAKDRFAPWGMKPNVFYDVSHNRRCRAHDVGDKLCYGMDDDADDALDMNEKEEEGDKPDDPTKPPDSSITPTEQPLSPQEEQQAERFMCHYMKKYPWMSDSQSKYSAMMSATNTSMPGNKVETKEPDMTEPEVQAFQKKLDDLTKAVAEKDAEIAKLKDATMRQERVAKYSKELQTLADDGYNLNVTEETLDVSEFTEEQFGKHVARIKKNYSKEDRAPIGHTIGLPTETPQREKPLSENDMQHVLKYVREKGMALDDAIKHYRKAN